MPDAPTSLPLQVRVMQIITLALAMGIATFAVILLLVIQPEVDANNKLMMYVGLLVACALIPAAWIIPELMAGRMPATVETYQTKLIVGLSMLEGGAFLNLVMYMVAGHTLSLAMAGLLLVLLLMRLPTVGGVQDWIDRRQRSADDVAAFRS